MTPAPTQSFPLTAYINSLKEKKVTPDKILRVLKMCFEEEKEKTVAANKVTTTEDF